LAYHQEEASSMKKVHLRDSSKKASKTVYTLTTMVCPDPLSRPASTSSYINTPANTEEKCEDSELADGDI
jgi:hypothetical protein